VVTDRAVESSQVWWAMEEVKVPTPHGRNSTRDKEEEEIKKGGKCISENAVAFSI